MVYARRLDDIPLFADEADIARAVLGPGRVAEWRAMAVVLEREGLPRVDPMMGRRCWPAVREWFTKRPAPAHAPLLPPLPAKVGAPKGPPSGDAPGLKWRPRKDGHAAYWVARHDIVKKGYRPETVRIHFNPQEPDHMQEIAARCRVLQQEMLQWDRNGGAVRRAAAFDGTFRSLAEMYQSDPDSPFQALRPNTKVTYRGSLKLLFETIGGVKIDTVLGPDVRRWYRDLRQPKPQSEKEKERGVTSKERIHRAFSFIHILRVVTGYGQTLKIRECEELRSVLARMEFEAGGPRRESRLTYDQVNAFRTVAHEMGRHSMALGLTLQFDLGMRQRDVIGEWLPDTSPGAEGIVDHGLRWSDGLAFSHIVGTVLRKRTSKTGKVVEHDLAQLPDTLAELERIPPLRRIGPLVLNEENGLPYKRRVYIKWFRIIARNAGIPDEVWSMDARAGAVTEALDAGAQPLDVMNAAGHTQLSTTQGYDRTSLQKASRVAKLRVESRRRPNSSGQLDPA